jgi:hypothetical protein
MSANSRETTHERRDVTYDLDQHRHRFALWAAARATQRGLCNVSTLCQALEHCGVVVFLRSVDPEAVTASEFDKRHREWCRSVVRFLRRRGVTAATFGRAAKLTAMYLKTMVVLDPTSKTTLARVVHPPIDSILLSAISSSAEITCGHAHTWGTTKWTQLNEASYYKLINELRCCVTANDPFWTLERFWDARVKEANTSPLELTADK